MRFIKRNINNEEKTILIRKKRSKNILKVKTIKNSVKRIIQNNHNTILCFNSTYYATNTVVQYFLLFFLNENLFNVYYYCGTPVPFFYISF